MFENVESTNNQFSSMVVDDQHDEPVQTLILENEHEQNDFDRQNRKIARPPQGASPPRVKAPWRVRRVFSSAIGAAKCQSHV